MKTLFDPPLQPEPFDAPAPVRHDGATFDPALDADRQRSIQERFDAWLDENPVAYELFKQFAEQARRAGRKRYSADAILHRLRWHVNVELRPVDGEEWRCNDHFSSRLARKLIEDDPSFANFFELRELKSA